MLIFSRLLPSAAHAWLLLVYAACQDLVVLSNEQPCCIVTSSKVGIAASLHQGMKQAPMLHDKDKERGELCCS